MERPSIAEIGPTEQDIFIERVKILCPEPGKVPYKKHGYEVKVVQNPNHHIDIAPRRSFAFYGLDLRHPPEEMPDGSVVTKNEHFGVILATDNVFSEFHRSSKYKTSQIVTDPEGKIQEEDKPENLRAAIRTEVEKFKLELITGERTFSIGRFNELMKLLDRLELSPEDQVEEKPG